MLARPGEQDLTATVNWTHVEAVCGELGWRTVCLERQDQFLIRAGILARLERLVEQASNETEALILRTSLREMILPGGIGGSFQVLVQKIQTGS